MEAFRRIVLVAGLGGLLAGLLLAAMHSLATVPLILEAEVHERAAAAVAGHEHGGDAWAPEDGAERVALTVLTDVLTAIGFGLLLVAGYVLAGREVGPAEGVRWGLAGFAAFALAPALGLPPELPGAAEAAPLLARQAWWLAAVVATGGGLALACLARDARWTVAGVALLALPHVYGAPQPAEHGGSAPAALAHDFVVAALVTSLLFWAALGSLTGFLFRRTGGVAAADGRGGALTGQRAG